MRVHKQGFIRGWSLKTSCPPSLDSLFHKPSLYFSLFQSHPPLILFPLSRVMDNAAVNKMYSQNVAIVFGPTLLRSEGDPFEMVKLTPVQNGIVELMLIEFDKIFAKKI